MITKRIAGFISIIFLSMIICSCSSDKFYSNSYLKDLGVETFPRMESKDSNMKDGSVEYTCTKSEYIDYCYEIISYLTSQNGIYYFGYTDRVDISDGGMAGLFQTFSLYPIDGYVVNEEINCFAYSLHDEVNMTDNLGNNHYYLIDPISITLSFISNNRLNLTIKQSGRLSYQWTEQNSNTK